MNTFRKIFGIVVLALAAYSAYFGITVLGYPKLAGAKDSSDIIFGIIVLFILLPIVSGGLAIFGYYALCNDYEINE